MEHFIAQYGLFFVETFTIAIAVLLVFAGLLLLANKNKFKSKEKLCIKSLNDKYVGFADIIREEMLPKEEYKKWLKEQKKAKKSADRDKNIKKRVFVLRFLGDMKASDLNSLREEITAILSIATNRDEVFVILDSPGGIVPNYGLAASQLERIRQKNIPLIIAVDRVAASGGYLMACVADRILAAPFAYIGSIGVVAQVPNFNKLLKKHNIDFEQITAGEFKRTLTLFGENTEQGRQKVQEEVNDIQYLFKDFIKHHRPHVDVDAVATGEYWPARRALELNLVDQLSTSDDYLLEACKEADVFELKYVFKKNLTEKLANAAQMVINKMFRQPLV